MKQKDFIFIQDLLTPEECNKLIKEYENKKLEAEKEHCSHAITGKDTWSTFNRVSLQPQTETFKIVHNATKKIIKSWIEYLKSLNCIHLSTLEQNLNFVHMYRLMCYEKGGWIHPHIDWDNFCHASFTIALNDNFEGGQFSFFNNKHDVDLKPGQGMIFPANSFWVHQVNEVTKGKRYSTNCFILSLPLEKQTEINNSLQSLKCHPSTLDYSLKFDK